MKNKITITLYLLICILTISFLGCDTTDEVLAGYNVYSVHSTWETIQSDNTKNIVDQGLVCKKDKSEPITYSIGEDIVTFKYEYSLFDLLTLQLIDYYSATHINGNSVTWESDKPTSDLQIRVFENGQIYCVASARNDFFSNCKVNVNADEITIFEQAKKIYNEKVKNLIGYDIDNEYQLLKLTQMDRGTYFLRASNINYKDKDIFDFIEFRFTKEGIFIGVWFLKADARLSAYNDFPENKKVLPDIKAHLSECLPENTDLVNCQIDSKKFVIYNDKICGVYEVITEINGDSDFLEKKQTVLIEIQ